MSPSYEPFLSFDKRKGVYYIYYYVEGNDRRRTSTGTDSIRVAKKKLREFKPPVTTVPSSNRKKKLSEFHAEKFKPYAEKKYKPKTHKHFNVAVNAFTSLMGDLLLADIDIEKIQLFLATVEHDTSIWSARKYYTALASEFARAKEWKYIENNPWREVAKPKEGERKPLFFEHHILDKFLEGVGEYDRAMYVFAVHTGMRLGEICAAKWKHVDWKKNIITVENGPTFKTKNNRSRNIPMSRTLHDLLKSLPVDGEAIFGLASNTVSHRFREYVLKAKWMDQRLHFHSLRHTFASWLVQRHTPLAEVQKLLGHASIKTTEIYAHLIDDTLQESVKVLDDIQYRQVG